MSANMRAGIAGLGILGRQYWDFFAQREDVEVVALCDVRRDAAEALVAAAAKAGAQVRDHPPAVYDDVATMAALERLDLVVIATPDHLHRSPTVAALEAGVPAVIQEKPLATTLADAEAICEAVERRRARLFVNFANRAMPLDVATYRIVQQGLIGAPVYAESRLDDNISVPAHLWGERSRSFVAASSTAHFLLSHVVDLMHWTFAPAAVREVFAIQQEQVLGHTPDLYDAYLIFDSGLKVRVKAEWIKHMEPIVEYYTAISGTEGTIFYNKRPGFGVQESWRTNFADAVAFEDVLSIQQQLATEGIALAAARHARPAGDGYYAPSLASSLEHRGPDGAHGLLLVGPMLEAVAQDTLQPPAWNNRGPLPTHVDGLRQVQVVAAIVESARSGRPESPN